MALAALEKKTYIGLSTAILGSGSLVVVPMKMTDTILASPRCQSPRGLPLVSFNFRVRFP